MKVMMRGQEIQLRRLTDPEYAKAAHLASSSGVSLSVCPTCGGKEEVIPESGGVKVFRNGTYRYRGEEHFCDCQAQIALRARYLLANIGEQYMRLNWDEYVGAENVTDSVALYLDKWKDFRINGMGLEFGGSGLGIGKTFAATHIGKEMVKNGQQVFFIPFVEMVSAFQSDSAHELEERIKTTTYVILDELLPSISNSQHQFYSMRLEAMIRHRTNHNLPTIITTNLSVEQLTQHYERTYSLLAAKQLRIDMTGTDARTGKIADENLELVANGEVRPIT